MVFEVLGSWPQSDGVGLIMYMLSPAWIVPFNEFVALDELRTEPWAAILVNFTWYGAMAVSMRWWCYRHAEGLLGCMPNWDQTPDLGGARSTVTAT